MTARAAVRPAWIPPGAVRLTLLERHVLDVIYTGNAPQLSVRGIGAEVGRSPEVVHRVLRRLRDLGLVTWERRAQGTLRPATRPVPVRL